MPGDIAHAVEEIAKDGSPAPRRPFEIRRRAQESDRAEIEEIAEDIRRERRRGAVMNDDPARQRRTGEDCKLRIGRVHGDGRREPFARHEARQHAKQSRHAETVDQAVQKGENDERQDREAVGGSKDRQRQGLKQRENVSRHHDAKPIDAIREHAAQRHESNIGGNVGERHDGEPGGGMGQRPCGPRDGDHLHEEAEPGDDRADRIDAKIPVGERFADAAQGNPHREPVTRLTLARPPARSRTAAPPRPRSMAAPDRRSAAPRATSQARPAAAPAARRPTAAACPI
jgi:hypothetical protein